MKHRGITLTVGAAAGALLAVAFIPVGIASADQTLDLDPFSDAGLFNGAAMDAALPRDLAGQLDTFVDMASPRDADPWADLLGPIGAPYDSFLASIGDGQFLEFFDLTLGPMGL